MPEYDAIIQVVVKVGDVQKLWLCDTLLLMQMPCDKIQEALQAKLIKKVSELDGQAAKRKLVSIVIGDNPEQESYVKIKKRMGESVGLCVQKDLLPSGISTNELVDHIKGLSADDTVSGIIIQQPLPKRLDIKEVYDSVDNRKEIEGHSESSPHVFPLVQACMIGLFWAYKHETSSGGLVNLDEIDVPFSMPEDLKGWLKSKSIAIAGNGITTGYQIAKHFKKHGIEFEQTNSKSRYPDGIYKKADIIISGVGKQILTDANIKPGATLLNFGLRRVMITQPDGVAKARLLGDYDEKSAKEKAAVYTATPGGLGPIDVLCLLANLIESSKRLDNN